MQAAASNTLAVLGAPMAEPTSSFDKVVPDAAASGPVTDELPVSVVSAFGRVAQRVDALYATYSQPEYRKYHMALLVILYTLASIAVGKWMEITQRGVDDDDHQPVTAVPAPRPATAAPSVAEPKGPPAKPRVEVMHDRVKSPVGASSTASASEVHRTASALLPDAEVRYRSYDSGSALDPDALGSALAQRGVDTASSSVSGKVRPARHVAARADRLMACTAQ